MGLSKTKSKAVAEALFAFAGWLTSRDEKIGPFSAKHNAAPLADAVAQFCNENGLPLDHLHVDKFIDQLRRPKPVRAIQTADRMDTPGEYSTAERAVVISLVGYDLAFVREQGNLTIGIAANWDDTWHDGRVSQKLAEEIMDVLDDPKWEHLDKVLSDEPRGG